jgi:hypothetical protein
MATLTALAHFNVNLIVDLTMESSLVTTVRFDTVSSSMVEENPLIVLPKKQSTRHYYNPDKPPPTFLGETLSNLSAVFEDGEVTLPVRR